MSKVNETDPLSAEHGKLTDNQRQAIDLLCEGVTKKDIAKQLDIHVDTIYKWEKQQPNFKACLISRQSQIVGEGKHKVDGMVPLALAEMLKLLESGSEKTKLEIIKSILLTKGILTGAGNKPIINQYAVILTSLNHANRAIELLEHFEKEFQAIETEEERERVARILGKSEKKELLEANPIVQED